MYMITKNKKVLAWGAVLGAPLAAPLATQVVSADQADDQVTPVNQVKASRTLINQLSDELTELLKGDVSTPQARAKINELRQAIFTQQANDENGHRSNCHCGACLAAARQMMTDNKVETPAETVKADTVKVDTAKDDTTKADTAKDDTTKVDITKVDNVKAEDTAKVDTDTTKVDTDTAKVTLPAEVAEPDVVEVPVEVPVAPEQTKTEQTKTEAPKADVKGDVQKEAETVNKAVKTDVDNSGVDQTLQQKVDPKTSSEKASKTDIKTSSEKASQSDTKAKDKDKTDTKTKATRGKTQNQETVLSPANTAVYVSALAWNNGGVYYYDLAHAPKGTYYYTNEANALKRLQHAPDEAKYFPDAVKSEYDASKDNVGTIAKNEKTTILPFGETSANKGGVGKADIDKNQTTSVKAETETQTAPAQTTQTPSQTRTTVNTGKQLPNTGDAGTASALLGGLSLISGSLLGGVSALKDRRKK